MPALFNYLCIQVSCYTFMYTLCIMFMSYYKKGFLIKHFYLKLTIQLFCRGSHWNLESQNFLDTTFLWPPVQHGWMQVFDQNLLSNSHFLWMQSLSFSFVQSYSFTSYSYDYVFIINHLFIQHSSVHWQNTKCIQKYNSTGYQYVLQTESWKV